MSHSYLWRLLTGLSALVLVGAPAPHATAEAGPPSAPAVTVSASPADAPSSATTEEPSPEPTSTPQPTSTQEAAPTESPAPTDDPAPPQEETPTHEATPADEATPAEQNRSLERNAPARANAVPAAAPAAEPQVAPVITSLLPTGSDTAGGRTVWIYGTGFGAGCTVVIDGITVNPEWYSSVEIDIYAPAHRPGTVWLSVECPGGSSSAEPFDYWYSLPRVWGLAPDRGPASGGSVTITGQDLWDAVVEVDGLTASILSTSPLGDELEVLLPPHAAGLVSIDVSTPGGTAWPQDYTYFAEPVISAVIPSSGPIAGGQDVSITGSNLTADSEVIVDGVHIVPDSIAAEGTSLRFTTLAHAAGAVEVTVTTAGGESGPLGYTYLPVPTAASLDPAEGPETGGQQVTISGTGFTADSEVIVDGTTVTPDAVNATTSLSFTTPDHVDGEVSVVVRTPGGEAQPLAYTYLAAPVVHDVSPDHGVVGGGEVSVSGSFGTLDSQDILVRLDGTTIEIVHGPTQIADFDWLVVRLPAHAEGDVELTMTTPGGTSAPVTYTYLATPTLTTMVRGSGLVTGGQTVTLTGTGLLAGHTSLAIGASSAAVAVSADHTSLTFVTPPQAEGPVEVTVQTVAGTSNALTFRYLPTPSASVLSPAAGPLAGGQSVTINGEGFGDDSIVHVDGVARTPVSVEPDGRELTFLTPEHAAASVTVTVTTSTLMTGQLTYTYVPVPIASSIVPDAGPLTGGQQVTITGSGFTSESRLWIDEQRALTFAVVLGGIAPAEIAPDGTSLTFTMPGHQAGVVSVRVVTPGGTSVALAYAFVAVPSASSLDPATGPAAGGQRVTISGAWFTTDATVQVDGLVVTPSRVAADGSSLTFASPAHAAGAVEVAVTSPGGRSAVLRYTYVADHAADTPQLTGSTPDAIAATGSGAVWLASAGFVLVSIGLLVRRAGRLR